MSGMLKLKGLEIGRIQWGDQHVQMSWGQSRGDGELACVAGAEAARTHREAGGARGRGRRDMVLIGGLPGLTVNETGWRFTRCASPCQCGVSLRSHSVLVLCCASRSVVSKSLQTHGL